MADHQILYDALTLEHLAEHGVSMGEFTAVANFPESVSRSRSTGREIAFGQTAGGRYLACVYERIDRDTIVAVTAYDVPKPKGA